MFNQLTSTRLRRGRCVRRIARFARRTEGNVAVLFALGMPLILGGAALSVETGFDYYKHIHLQSAADAAAYAGALEDRAGSANSAIQGAATTAAISNAWSASAGTIQVNSPPTSGGYTNATAVEVILTDNVPRIFSALFAPGPIQERARAVAIYQTAANACILALNKTSSQAVNISGSASVALSGCDIMSNSVASDAINVWGSAKVTSDCVVSAGGVNAKGGITLTGCPSLITQAPRALDPFSGVAAPAQPSNKQSVPNNAKTTTTLSPGWYSNGMNLSGSYVLSPGVYYVSGGDFKVGAGAQVSGSGVTIYLVSGSQVSMQGNATVNMTAPTSGPYAGILFFGDRSSPGGSNTFNGDSNSSLTGDIYFPTQQVTYAGNFSGSGGCTQLIADTVVWTGSSTINVDCSSQGMAAIPARQTVKLVE